MRVVLVLLTASMFVLGAAPRAEAALFGQEQAWDYTLSGKSFRPDLMQPSAPLSGSAPIDVPPDTSWCPDPRTALNVSGDLYSASPYNMVPSVGTGGVMPDPLTAITTDKLSALYGPADVTTVLVDGQYKPYYRQDLLLQPFVTGGVGLAMLDQGGIYSTGLNTASGGTSDRQYMPIYRFGGGLSYDLQKNLGVSLSYRASFAQDSGSSFLASSHDPSQMTMQMIDVGLNYKF